ncbi:MAG: UDP-N-acetylmuramoylalanyl-D-glutamyl-2, 6-diaminopimelate--D-alanyl-D-alanine ligase, partial [Magnetovibrio sp.]|nr:UDP-N-acetylmuramoylalanyl-D-glutamyl-2, 6-diaminopimelate--D-alanyl-D-alanine ligase [Magnetovibrio sp.]
APSGRGERFEVLLDGAHFLLIDESYNASPEALRAALAVLGEQPVAKKGRRIAVLGDMLEMGEDTPAMHAEIASVLEDNKIDLVFLAGDAMKHLWDVLPETRRGRHCATSDVLVDIVAKAVHPGDVVMVKGSAGMHMNRVVTALKSLDNSNPTKGEA